MPGKKYNLLSYDLCQRTIDYINTHERFTMPEILKYSGVSISSHGYKTYASFTSFIRRFVRKEFMIPLAPAKYLRVKEIPKDFIKREDFDTFREVAERH